MSAGDTKTATEPNCVGASWNDRAKKSVSTVVEPLAKTPGQTAGVPLGVSVAVPGSVGVAPDAKQMFVAEYT